MELHQLQLGWLWCLVLCALLHSGVLHSFMGTNTVTGDVLDQASNAYALFQRDSVVHPAVALLSCGLFYSLPKTAMDQRKANVTFYRANGLQGS